MGREFVTATESRSDVLIMKLAGHLDVSLQTELKDQIETAARQEGDIILDFSAVDFIDSSCLGAIVSSAKDLRAKKGDVKLAALQDDVRSIFQITRLDKVLEIHDSVDEAIESYYR